MILEGQSLDYAALCAGMNRAAASLQRDGLGPGDVLAICAGASIEYVLAYSGRALRRGGRGAAGALGHGWAPERHAGQLRRTPVLRDREVAAQWPLHEGAALHQVALDDVPEAGQPWSQWLATGDAALTPSRLGPTGRST